MIKTKPVTAGELVRRLVLKPVKPDWLALEQARRAVKGGVR